MGDSSAGKPLHKSVDLSLIPRIHVKKLDMVACICVLWNGYALFSMISHIVQMYAINQLKNTKWNVTILNV